MALRPVLALVAACFILAACVGAPNGQVVAPIQITADVNGEIQVSSLMVGGMPFTYPIKAWGVGTVTLQYPNQPHVDFVGDGGWVIEPITPQDRARVEQLVASGAIRGAKLVPAGTIATLQESN